MEILKTTNANLFETINGNRNLSAIKIKKIVDDIKKGLNMLPYSPIIVSKGNNGKFKVIDGQHRLSVSIATENPIYYVICDDMSLAQIAQINSRQEKWSPADFLKCYIKLGIKDYNDIEAVVNEFKISISLATSLLMYYNQNPGYKEAFQSGNFKSNYFEQTKKVLRLTNRLFSRYVFSKDKDLILAVIKIVENGKCDFDKLAEKIEQSPNTMDRQGSTKSYIYNIERLYNHKNSKREVIY